MRGPGVVLSDSVRRVGLGVPPGVLWPICVCWAMAWMLSGTRTSLRFVRRHFEKC